MNRRYEGIYGKNVTPASIIYRTRYESRFSFGKSTYSLILLAALAFGIYSYAAFIVRAATDVAGVLPGAATLITDGFLSGTTCFTAHFLFRRR